MIERGQFIEAVGEWYSSSLTSPHDGLLCAFVKLRLLTADVPGLLHPTNDNPDGHVHNPRPLMKIMEDQIDRWQRQWTKTLERGKVSSSEYPITILTNPRAFPPVSNSILWRTYSIASIFTSFAVISFSEVVSDRHGGSVDQLQRSNQNAASGLR
jgi:hypothetical protein